MEKLDQALGLATAHLLAEVAKAARSAHVMLNAKANSGSSENQECIGVEVDLSELVGSDRFCAESDTKNGWLREFCRVFKGHVASADGLGGMIEEHAVVASAVRAMVARVRVSVCPEDKVRSDVGGSYGDRYELLYDAASPPRPHPFALAKSVREASICISSTVVQAPVLKTAGGGSWHNVRLSPIIHTSIINIRRGI